jgi:hypothetical protein
MLVSRKEKINCAFRKKKYKPVLPKTLLFPPLLMSLCDAGVLLARIQKNKKRNK